MTRLLEDVRHALRLYRRTPGASLTALVVLAIGVTFVAAVLSLYVDLVLRPYPGFDQSSRIVTVGQTGSSRAMGMPLEIVERMADEMTSVEAVATLRYAYGLIGSDGERVGIELASAEFFDGLRPRLALGRGLSPEEHRADAEPVAVISYRLWQQRFGGNPDVLGTAIEVTRDPNQGYLAIRTMRMGQTELQTVTSGEPEQETTSFRIVGVMAPALPGLVQAESALWVSLERAYPLFIATAELAPSSLGRTYVRAHAGVSAAAVAREIETRYENAMPPASSALGMQIDAVEGIVDDIAVQRDAKRQLQILLAGSVLLALVAAANVSLFLLARAPGRRRELGIRMAVGAPSKRLARQLATEASLLVVASAALGLVLSAWLATYLRSLVILRQAEWQNVTLLDWRVLCLAGAVLLLLAALVSLTPILGIRRLGIGASSRETMTRASLAQRLAGTVQIAVAGALGGAAVAFGWYIGALTFGDPGYAVADRYMVGFNGGSIRSGTTLSGYIVELARRREIIEAVPGITAVGFGRPVPGAQDQSYAVPLRDLNDANRTVSVQVGMLDARFVEVLGLRLLSGRGPGVGEEQSFGDSVALVNQSFARAYWGREDVVGERLPNRPGNYWSDAEVVGVLEDISFKHPAAEVEPFMFMSLNSGIGESAVVHTGMTPAQLRQSFESLAASGALELEVNEIRSLESLRNELIAPDRARGLLTLVTAGIVVFLAAFGYYGTQRYLVASGRREYAIRSSLGAGPRRLGRLVIRRGLFMSLPGLVVGGILGFIVVAWLRDNFVSREISPSLVTAWVVLGLGMLLLAATIGPARSASRTEPAATLREE